MRALKNITPLEENFAKWFTDVVKQGNLINYGPVKGTIVFKPIAYGIWENIQKEMNIIFKKNNIQNVYLPLLIPKSYILKEKNHIKGFAPELATVTKVGNKELEKEYVIRPTSETLFAELFQKEITSYNDLPIQYNQWVNVLRWEKTTNPFLRNSEFLWQEGHTSHSNALEARKITRKMIKNYAKFFEKYLAIPVIIGKKTTIEKFAGAVSTYTTEAMMKDGKALQVGTSHYLGKNFSKVFNIQFKNKDNKWKFVYQTSWGMSTRLIGAIIMVHGDNRGIIIPPMIAPNQIDVIEIITKQRSMVQQTSQKIVKMLSKKYRVRLNDSNRRVGFKVGQSEIEGTPLRIEVGLRDLEKNEVTLVRRDNLEKIQVNIKNIKTEVTKTLQDIQTSLYDAAKNRLNQNIIQINSYDEMKQKIKANKFVIVPFAGTTKDEQKIKNETTASIRCIPFDYKLKKCKPCIITKKCTKKLVIFSKAY